MGGQVAGGRRGVEFEVQMGRVQLSPGATVLRTGAFACASGCRGDPRHDQRERDVAWLRGRGPACAA